MANAYADLAALKSPSVLNVTDDAHDARLLTLLEAASRWIDGYCGRSFATTHGERRFDGRGRADLSTPDLVAASRVKARDASGQWESWPSDSWLLYPLNAAPTEPGGRPYTRILLTSGERRRFPLNRAGVAVNGVWGYCDVREDAGLRVADDPAVKMTDTTVAVAPVSPDAAITLSPGHTVRIGDEQLYVANATSGDGNVTLSALRGVNGTDAAAHAAGAALSVYRYPDAVAEACLQLASVWWRVRPTEPAPTASFPAADQPPEAYCGDATGVPPTVRALLRPFRRRTAALGV